MIISLNDLNQWKSNSLKLAIREGYDLSILDFIEKNANLRLIRRLPPKGIWYGYCYYDQKSPEIEVYYRNLSTESIDTIVIALIIDYCMGTNKQKMSDGFYLGAAIIILAIFAHAYVKTKKIKTDKAA